MFQDDAVRRRAGPVPVELLDERVADLPRDLDPQLLRVVIDQDDGIIFYYMRERAQGTGLFLVLFNTTSLEIDYDRAIFFFDDKGMLVEYAYSKLELPVAKPE